MGKLIPSQTTVILGTGLKTRVEINARNEGGVCTRSGPQESVAFHGKSGQANRLCQIRMAILRPASQTLPLAGHRIEAVILTPKSIVLGTNV